MAGCLGPHGSYYSRCCSDRGLHLQPHSLSASLPLQASFTGPAAADASRLAYTLKAAMVSSPLPSKHARRRGTKCTCCQSIVAGGSAFARDPQSSSNHETTPCTSSCCVHLHNICGSARAPSTRCKATRGRVCRAAQQQQKGEAADNQRQQEEVRQAAAVQDSTTAAAPMRMVATGSNQGSGSKYALMTTMEENASIDAINELVALEPEVEERGEFLALLIGGAFLFGGGIWAAEGPDKGAEFFAGYLLEQSLSVDNLFVFVLVFNFLQVPKQYQSKVLTFGILSAALLRGLMIAAGAELLANFKPILVVFAVILLLSSYKLLVSDDEEEDEDLSDNGIVKFCRQFIRVSDKYDGENFFTVQDGQQMATPLLLALAVIEISDVVFAVDSVPAVFGVTQDPFLVYTSNMWAILSLRALYGFVATVLGQLRFLNKAVAVVLGFVGAKLIGEFLGFGISVQASLAVVASVLGSGVALSLLLPETAEKESSG